MKYSVVVYFKDGFDTVYEGFYEKCKWWLYKVFDERAYARHNNVIIDEIAIVPEDGNSIFE